MIDYKRLLEKYMEVIRDAEGITFMFDARRSKKFTEEELAELNRIDQMNGGLGV